MEQGKCTLIITLFVCWDIEKNKDSPILPQEAGQQEHLRIQLFPPLWKEKPPVSLKDIKYINTSLKPMLWQLH